ncbi:MAG: hypothetical protein ACYCVB_16110, partial [Bacilli bacterium]
LGTDLVPAHPIPLITGNPHYTGGGSTIPVTVLPFTSGVEMTGARSKVRVGAHSRDCCQTDGSLPVPGQ